MAKNSGRKSPLTHPQAGDEVEPRNCCGDSLTYRKVISVLEDGLITYAILSHPTGKLMTISSTSTKDWSRRMLNGKVLKIAEDKDTEVKMTENTRNPLIDPQVGDKIIRDFIQPWCYRLVTKVNNDEIRFDIINNHDHSTDKTGCIDARTTGIRNMNFAIPYTEQNTTPERNPRIDPKPGDRLCRNPQDLLCYREVEELLPKGLIKYTVYRKHKNEVKKDYTYTSSLEEWKDYMQVAVPYPPEPEKPTRDPRIEPLVGDNIIPSQYNGKVIFTIVYRDDKWVRYYKIHEGTYIDNYERTIEDFRKTFRGTNLLPSKQSDKEERMKYAALYIDGENIKQQEETKTFTCNHCKTVLQEKWKETFRGWELCTKCHNKFLGGEMNALPIKSDDIVKRAKEFNGRGTLEKKTDPKDWFLGSNLGPDDDV